MKLVVIAGATSGVGKTTIATAIMGSLARRGLRVQPFKAGPDYIDPTYHTWAAGRPSRNLDTWLLPRTSVLDLLERAMAGMDIGVVEGVMGLYDGRASSGEQGSTAELAKTLNAPVVLVADAARAARSVGALVLGYQKFDPDLRLRGVILNRIGSTTHYAMCREAIEQATGVPVLGYMPRRDDLSLPERHLGLIPTVEGVENQGFLDRLIAQAEATLDISRLISLAEEATPVIATRPSSSTSGSDLFPRQKIPAQVRIGVAMDKAFSFYYQDSLDLLEAWGAELAHFSPLEDSCLPTDISGVYLGGGFPEMYAQELAENRGMLESLRKVPGAGMPVYAECGGLMYLGKSTTDLEGREYPMVGILPVTSRLDGRRLSLGYRTVRALGDGPLLRRGEEVRGHEFHWSVMSGGEANAYEVVGEGRREGFHLRNILASYVHIHMGSLPAMPRRFIESCREFRKETVGGVTG